MRLAALMRYGVGELPAHTTPGDLVLTHRHTWAGRSVGFGQRLRFRGARRPFAYWTHVACVGGVSGQLVEALGHGVERTNLEHYREQEFHVVVIDATDHDRAQMVRFLDACVGRPYGWASIISLGLHLATGCALSFGNPGTLICSGLAAQMLCRGETIFERDPSQMMPADLAEHFGVSA